MTPNPNPSPELLSRASEILAQAYERADLICPAADLRSGNKIDWVREKVALDAIVSALSPQTLPAPGEVELREALESIRDTPDNFVSSVTIQRMRNIAGFALLGEVLP